MALHTTVLFIAAFLGILYCRPGCGIMALVSSESVGGKLIRRVFPVAILIPTSLGWLKLWGERTGQIPNEIGVALVASGNLTLMSLFIYMFCFWVDKADSKRMKSEESVREGEQKYRALFENSRDAIMILKPPLWKFASGNPATIEMFRTKTESTFVSLGPWDLSPERQPDGSSSSQKARERIETAVRDGFCFFEWQHKRLDGEEFPATVLLTRMMMGREMIVQATVRDITDRKRVEAALKEKMEELERFNRIAIGRELKMVELKERIKILEEGKK